MTKIYNTKNILRAMAMMVMTICALSSYAQGEGNFFDEYFQEKWYSCEPGANQTTWRITKVKPQVGFEKHIANDRGHIIFSDDCVEIKCGTVQTHFPVQKYVRTSDNSFKIYGADQDDMYNYMEIIPDGNQKDRYRLLFAYLEDNGDLSLTIIIYCEPAVYSYGKTEAEARMMKNTKSVGLPVQVRK